MNAKPKVGDTFIKDGYEYVVLATREEPGHYGIEEGKDYVVSHSFYVEIIQLSEEDLKEIRIEQSRKFL